MIYLLLSILASTILFVIFKYIGKHKVNTLQAIVVNYFTASCCGFLFYEFPINTSEIINSSWFYATFALGLLFISVFNVMALTAQKNGLSVAAVAGKMSVIIPILFGVYVYNESIGFQKIFGIILALSAVYLTSVKPKVNDSAVSKNLLFPILLFLGSGIIDTSINHYAPDDKIPLFSAIVFLVAGCIGCFSLAFQHIRYKSNFELKSIPYGLVLGTVNYFSIYFLLKALRIEGFETSVIFTVNNVAIVAFSTLLGLILFKEKLSKFNWAGIVIAIVAIVLVTIKTFR